MKVHVAVQHESERKNLFRRDVLTRLAHRICTGEGVRAKDVEISVLFCDDARIRELNSAYRDTDKATDVLSFEQEAGPSPDLRVLGDIVISLETVEGRNDDRAAMRDDVRLLFCHGMLHLFGYDHGTAAERQSMTEKQAQYLGVDHTAAWRTDT